MLEHILSHALKENKIMLNKHAEGQLIQFLNRMTIWNRAFNLTRITEPKPMVYDHIIDSLVIHPYLQGSRCLDVGSGAGLPGIPLAIMDSKKYWTLVDKNNKKTHFLNQIVAELKLSHIEVCHTRVEEYNPPLSFDSILSRAFGTIRVLIEKTSHLLGEKGIMIAMKGQYPQEELDDIPNLFMVKDVIRLNIVGSDVKRHIVILQKRG